MTKIERAKHYLRSFYGYLGSDSPWDSFSHMIEHYRYDSEMDIYHDDFLEFFGGALQYSKGEDILKAMQALAIQTKAKQRAPSSQAFYDALNDQVLKFDWDDVHTITKETGKDIAKVGGAIASGYIVSVLASITMLYLIKGKR